IGYGLTSSHESAGERATEGPELSFNYLGQFDGGSNETAFEMSALSGGNSMSPRSRAAHLIEVSCMVAGGAFQIKIGYSSKHFAERTASALGERFIQQLERIIDHCSERKESELTPSDMMSSDLSIEELEELNQEIAMSIELD
ncbi:hypothetical protein K0T92_24445, partial [Paenibacillus oenotherae]